MINKTWIWLLDKSDNHGSWIRLYDNKIYFEMTRGTVLLSDPVSAYYVKVKFAISDDE